MKIKKQPALASKNLSSKAPKHDPIDRIALHYDSMAQSIKPKVDRLKAILSDSDAAPDMVSLASNPAPTPTDFSAVTAGSTQPTATAPDPNRQKQKAIFANLRAHGKLPSRK